MESLSSPCLSVVMLGASHDVDWRSSRDLTICVSTLCVFVLKLVVRGSCSEAFDLGEAPISLLETHDARFIGARTTATTTDIA